MALRCKPGELCVFLCDSVRSEDPRTAGMYCTTVNVAPVGRAFRMPNGHYSAAVTKADCWVVKLVTPISVLTENWITGQVNGSRKTRYTTIPDKALRPIRDPGPDAVDEMLLLVPVPSTEKEPA